MARHATPRLGQGGGGGRKQRQMLLRRHCCLVIASVAAARELILDPDGSAFFNAWLVLAGTPALTKVLYGNEVHSTVSASVCACVRV